MLNIQNLAKAIGILRQIKYFPADDEFRAGVMETLGEICETDEQVLWLARAMRDYFSEWPGTYELRAVFCTKYSPKDRRRTISAVFPEGLPEGGSTGSYALPKWEPLQIAGPPVTEDDRELAADLQDTVQFMALAKGMKKPDADTKKGDDWRRVESMLEQMGL